MARILWQTDKQQKMTMNKLELAITKAWQQQSSWLWLLSPLSLLYAVATKIQQQLYRQGIKSVYRAAVPVLVIGNITVGGSGKTPLLIALINYLQSKGISVGAISRGYGRKTDNHQLPVLVSAKDAPSDVGDEPCLIVQSTGVPMAVGADRGRAIELLLQHYPDTALIISDDGLQHHGLHRDAEWIVVDSARGFGNAKLLPQGFLREPISRLQTATVIYHDTQRSQSDMSMHLEPMALTPLIKQTLQAAPTSKTVYAVSGIGYPARFFATVANLGHRVIPKPFADHHEFVLSDLLPLGDYPMVVTSKDAVKLRQLAKQSPHEIFANIWVLPVQAVLSPSIYVAMDELLKKWHIV